MMVPQRHQATAVWTLLMLATGLSWLFSAREGEGSDASVAIGIIVLAFIKIRLIIMNFMEVRKAPALLRWFCEGWVVVVCSALVGFYVLSPG